MTLAGNPLDYLWAFLAGMAISFTPCVYPLVPITAGFIGIKAGGNKIKGLFLGFIYVTGIAVTYSLLGLIASLTGKIFGSISSRPITYLFTGIVIILFGFSMLGLFKIPFLNLVKPAGSKKEGYFSVFFLGLSSGLVVSPCLSPALGSILAYLITRKNIFYGTTLLLTFAYGMGVLLILVGTFSTLLLAFPKSGRWMEHIKKICAFIIIAMGLYFVVTGLK
ncbi:MAG: sulfite exporter TauE/SafE family protein, partial [Candidatus Omnitrophica bacterium]|nr:sulfite exporter TauE/SafE family protein [Candidatus Omnitrophota bacterium]